jgi:HTH-type transcriptional regulator/antitoxin HigA
MTTAARVTHVIRSEEEYDVFAAEVDRLLEQDPREGTPAHDRLELLTVLIEAYDDEHYPLNDKQVTPQEAVEFMLEQQGKTHRDLADMLGGRSRVSEFLNGKRRLSIEQIRTVREKLGIPADLLIE